MKRILLTLASALLCLGALAQPGQGGFPGGGFPGGGPGGPGGPGGGGPGRGNDGNPFAGMSQEEIQAFFQRMNQPPEGDTFTMKEIHCKSAGEDLYGEAYIPNAPGKHPAIIMSHGFNGTRTSFYDNIRDLVEKGYVCYCYDFAGGSTRSKSTGDTRNMSIFTEKQNLTDVLDMVRGWDFVDPDKIILMGESQGGCVSAITAPDVASKIKGIVLAYPALCIPDDGRALYKSVADVPEESEFMGMKLGKEYYNRICDPSYDIYADIARYEGKVIIVHGGSDSLVKPEYSALATNAYKDAELHIIFGAGHGFMGEEQRTLYKGYIYPFIDNLLK